MTRPNGRAPADLRTLSDAAKSPHLAGISTVATLAGIEQVEIVAQGPTAVREAARKVREERKEKSWQDRVAGLETDERLAIAAHMVATDQRPDVVSRLADEAGVSVRAIQTAVWRLATPREQRESERTGTIRTLTALQRADVSVAPVLPPSVCELDKQEGLALVWRQGFGAAALNLGDARRPTDPDGAEAWDAGARRFRAILSAWNGALSPDAPQPILMAPDSEAAA